MRIELIEIKEGAFVCGSSLKEIDEIASTFGYAFSEFRDDDVRSWLLKQYPSHTVELPRYFVGKYPVTNSQFAEYESEIFEAPTFAKIEKPNAPVEGVGFYDSVAFCQWASRRDGILYRLPTEFEWEFAASSRGRFLFPWGNRFHEGFANTAETGRGCTSDVWDYVSGASAQGVCDLAGNVEEWTSTMYLPYPGGKFIRDRISVEAGGVYPVLRGGSYAHHADLCLAKRRHGYRPNYSISGFRLATSFAPPYV